MTLLQRWRFQPAFPCPPCIPLSRCCPDRPQPWHRLPRNRLVFLRRVAMGTFFPVAWISRVGEWGSRAGFNETLPGFDGLSVWRKPIRALSWTGVVAGVGLVFAGVRRVMGGSCCQARSKRPVGCKGLGRAGLRRLSRRGSWVQIPPPAPNRSIPLRRILACFLRLGWKNTAFFCNQFWFPVEVYCPRYLTRRSVGSNVGKRTG